MRKMFSKVDFERDWEVLTRKQNENGTAVVEVRSYGDEGKGKGMFRLFRGAAKLQDNAVKGTEGGRSGVIGKVAVSEETSAVESP